MSNIGFPTLTAPPAATSAQIQLPSGPTCGFFDGNSASPFVCSSSATCSIGASAFACCEPNDTACFPVNEQCQDGGATTTPSRTSIGPYLYWTSCPDPASKFCVTYDNSGTFSFACSSKAASYKLLPTTCAATAFTTSEEGNGHVTSVFKPGESDKCFGVSSSTSPVSTAVTTSKKSGASATISRSSGAIRFWTIIGAVLLALML